MRPNTLFFKLFVGLLAFIAYAPAAALAASRTVELSLVLICDIYQMQAHDGRGGYARIAGAIKAERHRNKNVLVAHAGDAISPSLFSGFDQGAHAIDLMNMIAPDIFVPGNHEFDFGEKIYRKRMAEARFPILAANLRDADGNKLPRHEDFKIFDVEGVKIAVIGLTADNSPTKSQPGTLRFAATVATAKRLAAQLRNKGADLVVAVAHARRRQDLRLFYSHKLDVLLSGDDHDLVVLYDGRTAMAESKLNGEYVTAIDLEITVREKADGSRKVRWWPRFRIIDTADVTPDAAVAARVAHYEALVAKELDVALGTTTTPLDSRKATVRTGESAIGNLIADAMRAGVGADVAIINGGAIRGNRTYDAGSELTRRAILTELPFGDKLYLLELTGADLLKVLENGLKYAGKPNGRFIHVSGATITARINALPGKRISLIDIGNEPLDPKKLYKLAVNDFMAAGKEGNGVLKTAKRLVGAIDAPLLTNAVMSYIRKKGSVSPRVEGRIVLQ